MPVISYKDFQKNIPKREDYINPAKYQAVEALIRKNEPLPFLPTYLYETTFYDYDSKEQLSKIVLNGIFPDGRRTNVVVENFEPYFEVRIPNNTHFLDEQLRGKDYDETKYTNKLLSLIKKEA